MVTLCFQYLIRKGNSTNQQEQENRKVGLLNMEKSLKNIQTLAKIGRVLCRIAWICSIVGAAGCAAGILGLIIGLDEILKFGGVTIHGIIANESGLSIGSMYASMAVGMILCIGELVIVRFAERYFKNELSDGTPFTLKGAAEMQRLGILTICISLGVVTAAEITYQIINHTFPDVSIIHIGDYASVGFGIAFIIMSVVFRYGAALEEEKSNLRKQRE